MMTREQAQTIKIVLRKFSELDASSEKWTPVDEALFFLSHLNDKEIVNETKMILEIHRMGNPRCTEKHENSECFIPKIVEAVESIIELYKENNSLPAKNRYILQYYIVLSNKGEIIS
jgi:hypothetical protein